MPNNKNCRSGHFNVSQWNTALITQRTSNLRPGSEHDYGNGCSI
jgi:hypothetical protein